MNYLNHINLNQNELQNAVIQPLGTPPSNPKQGQIYFDSNNGTKLLFFYNGTTWVPIKDTDNYVDELTFNTVDGVLTLGRSGILANLTVGLDGRYLTAHPATNPAGSVNNSGRTYIQDIQLDSFGHIVGITSATETMEGRIYSVSVGAGGTNSATIVLTGSDASTDSVTISGTDNEIQVTESGDQINIGLPDDVTITRDLVVGGNLTVNGTVTTVNTETVNIADNIITLNSNATSTPTENAGIEVERGDATNVTFRWNETTDRWEFTNDGTTYYNVPITGDTNFSTTVGSAATIPVLHNLNSKDVRVELYDTTTGETLYTDVMRSTVNTVTLYFTTAPAANSIRVLITKV